MIKVTSTFVYASEGVRKYISHVTIDGSRSEIISEIKALIQSFEDDPELEDIYLSIATESAKTHLEDLERTLRGLKNIERAEE